MKNKKSFIQGALCGALAILLTMGLVSCGLRVRNGVLAGNSGSGSTDKKISTLRGLINNSYMGDVDEEALREGVYKGFVNGLGDPYSVYYDEEETKTLIESTEGEYDGIGAVLSQDINTGVVTLVQIYDGSPASEAGLMDNDILYKVEDIEVTGMEIGRASCRDGVSAVV